MLKLNFPFIYNSLTEAFTHMNSWCIYSKNTLQSVETLVTGIKVLCINILFNTLSNDILIISKIINTPNKTK